MEKTLIGGYRFTFDEYMVLDSYFKRANTTVGKDICRTCLGLLFLAFGIYAGFYLDALITLRVCGSFCCFTLAFIFLFHLQIHRQRMLRKAYFKSKSQDEDIILKIKEENILVEGALASSKISWPVFEEAIIAPLGIVLCNETRSPILWLPKSSFSEEDHSLLEALVRRKIDKITELT